MTEADELEPIGRGTTRILPAVRSPALRVAGEDDLGGGRADPTPETHRLIQAQDRAVRLAADQDLRPPAHPQISRSRTTCPAWALRMQSDSVPNTGMYPVLPNE